ncbi:MAG: hypothetical protein P4L36_10595 [Holophaga sp.]|nr:hypothetical protein [Holophaga sp.]
MRCPRCGHEQTDALEVCRRCGVYFARFRPRPVRRPVPKQAPGLSWLRQRLFEVPPAEDRLMVVLRAFGWLVLVVWGIRILTLPFAGPELLGSFLHWIHLPFHEAGHVVFRPFGSFLHILGGTLGQLLVPLIVLGAFLHQKDPFGAAFGCWWLGTSFIDCAPYINDARARQLLLISGETGQEGWEGHDWFQLLSRTGHLEDDHLLARGFWAAGALLVLAALAWGGYVLWRQWRGPQKTA